jgi:hypothetical protein
MKNFSIFKIFFLCATFCQVSIAANVTYKPSDSPLLKDCSSNLIILNGDLAAGDSSKLLNTLNQLASKYQKDDCKNGFLSIQLNSNGGDVFESIKIGRVIRSYNLHTIVPFNAVCNSSCVFLLASGVRRSPIGQVGIHRPYFAAISPNLTANEIQSKRNELTKQIREFIDEIDVSQALLDKMLSVPPEKIKILSATELEELRLSIDDANYEEKQIADQASLYNLTSAEYRNRLAIADKACRQYFHNNISEYTICRESILIQISKNEAKKRLEKTITSCSNLDQEKGIKCWKKIVVMGQ